MQGLCARQDGKGFDFSTFPKDPMRVALWAYDIADAMMEARKTSNETLRLFALSAGFHGQDSMPDGFTLISRREIERLTYLIIQECATLVDTMEYSGKQLKEHFGVLR